MEKLIISDIHLRSLRCNAKGLLELLEKSSYEELIIAGDLSEEEGNINDEQFELIKYLRCHREKIVYIDGNHDRADEALVSSILGIPMRKKYEWSMGGKKFYAAHGDKLDWASFIFDEPLIDKIFHDFMWLFKKINLFGFNAVRWHDGFHDNFSNFIANKAAKYARKKNIDVIICGHTHKPVHLVFPGKNGKEIHYFNSGGWIKGLCSSYITIDEYGEVQLHLLAP